MPGGVETRLGLQIMAAEYNLVASEVPERPQEAFLEGALGYCQPGVLSFDCLAEEAVKWQLPPSLGTRTQSEWRPHPACSLAAGTIQGRRAATGVGTVG